MSAEIEGPPNEADLPTEAEEIEEEIVAAAGISSTVFSDYGGDPSTEESVKLGHVLLLDYDDDPDIQRMYEEVADLDGISVILESSPGSYHVWNLSIRPWEETVLSALETHSDETHIAASHRRGYFVLRGSAKIYHESGEVYKESPSVTEVVRRPSDRPQSRVHREVLESLARDRGEDLDLAEAIEAEDLTEAGTSFVRSTYLTLTDRGKRVV